MVDHWLVRTKDNIIAGPYSGDQIRKLILEGHLSYQDEICQANHYWIYVHERQEVKNHLGIDVPKPRKGDEEVTETETLTETVLEMEQSLGGGGGSKDGDGGTRVGTLMARTRSEVRPVDRRQAHSAQATSGARMTAPPARSAAAPAAAVAAAPARRVPWTLLTIAALLAGILAKLLLR